ncbi:fatty acid desaturase family protein [Oceanicola granulosus HTCC2516]|uniref:Fatty acid desaturase family protein n=1 Tax=Oceanicola granulosus (strain ATCC BAA-861 / DSM 15982 / KCTC 12143 / HTCC2516) TaxID=314256 RepID=Q2CFE0_OCEGH|nr:fatty acid desaturase [Oceanicola granulosus]EAR51355.1 fatty acid desaturase family protein [Oceanicola granulosus HTCC2516]
MSEPRTFEWPTLALLAGCYALWAAALFGLAALSPWLALPALVVALVLHSSLQHEAIHGHPFRNRRLNAALVWPALGLLVPFGRFRDTHLAHHHDAILTDPYDDPESNYLDPAAWRRLPRWLQAVLRVNNTLAGRIVIGPLAGQVAFLAGDWRARHEPAVRAAWAAHLPASAVVLSAVALAPLPLPAYLAAAYAAMSVLKIRTFLEHQAHEKARARTVIIEDRGPLALLFLNNNLHVVHHMHPRVPWYRLPRLYARNPARYLGVNGGYRYRSYAEILARYFWRAKDPVPHPLRGG